MDCGSQVIIIIYFYFINLLFTIAHGYMMHRLVGILHIVEIMAYHYECNIWYYAYDSCQISNILARIFCSLKT